MKLHAKLLTAGTLTLATSIIAACQGETRQAPVGGEAGFCRRDAAEALVGRSRVSDDEARQLTGASLVRQIRPGQSVTMDFRQERVTIETDPKSGKIIRAFCG
ncbi:I78 family peptidase inhibitor [Bosea sp. (in: a-proteobacteria)]|uniref:I78 family peptidase inhibitor n=1 Tax=Bosea sp. (in: a-proteobacteria) TaxID=1871050 RepID=UPI0031FEFC7D